MQPQNDMMKIKDEWIWCWRIQLPAHNEHLDQVLKWMTIF
jgi:hypothetical protein